MMRTRRQFLTATAAGAASVALAGCGGEEVEDPDGEGTIDDEGDDETETVDDEPLEVTVTQGALTTTLDPQNHSEVTTDNVVAHAYEGVLFRDEEGRIIESIADDWERIGEEHVQFSIREDATFHSGDPVTPEDVAFSIERTIDPDVGGIASPRDDNLADVAGAEAGDGVVDVYTDGANPIVFDLFAAFTGGYVMQRSWVEEREPGDVAQEMNGSGPFELAEFEEDVFVEFEANDDYWGGRPDVDRLRFEQAPEASSRVSALLTGETDLIVNVPPHEAPRIQDEETTRIEAVRSARTIFCVMRYDVEPFDSTAFRRAMNYAVDLETLIDDVLSGFGGPTGQPTLEGHTGYNPDVGPYPYDPDRAEELVAESGYEGAEIELHTPIGRYLNDVEVAQTVAGYIDDLDNVDCTVNQRDFGALVSQLLDGDITTSPHFYLIGWGNQQFDASQVIVPWLHERGSNMHYQDDHVNDLLDAAADETDPDERDELLREANAYLHEEAPWVYLHNEHSVYGINDDLVWEPRVDELVHLGNVQRQ